jgi:D-alanyl-D-alanine carboxypeptidase
MYQKYVIWVMRLVVDACYGGGVMQHGGADHPVVKGGASMKRILLWMKGLVVTALATLVLSGCGGDTGSTEQQRSPSEPTQQTSGGEERFSAANLKGLDTTIAGIMNDKNLPGVLVAVSVPGEGEYLTAQGKANLDTGRAPDPDDQFRMGSVTKTFVATAVLQLVDEGELNKSDTLSKWYPDFPNAEKITIDDLLRMRSGMPDYWDEEALKQYYDDPLEQMTSEDVIKAAASKADKFEPPDQETKYNNTNYNILAAIVEKVSGNDINTQISENILKPLGLKNTLYPTNNELPGELHGYGLNPQSGEFEDKTILNPTPVDGAGAMISNTSDLGVWAKALYNGDLLSSQTQQARLQTQPAEGMAPSSYGEGIFEGTEGVWGHGGEIPGFSTDMWYIPEQDATIVISVNRCDETYDRESGEVLLAVLKSLFPEYVPSG